MPLVEKNAGTQNLEVQIVGDEDLQPGDKILTNGGKNNFLYQEPAEDFTEHVDEPLVEPAVIYPRWIHHAKEKPVLVKNKKEAEFYYAKGFQPWPLHIEFGKKKQAEVVNINTKPKKK